ncbi:Protein quaking [Trichinella sp. T9]|nr:Protein quaking [Trichinella sp. T9]
MTGRIIGPRGYTVKIFVEPDYESIVKFKVWKAFQLIYCLLRMDPTGKDMQPYHSDVNDINAVSSNHYSVVEMLKVLEKQMLTCHMNNLLVLPMFHDIFSIQSPAASGRVTNGCAKKIYSLLDFPFNIAGRIIGPRGLTVKVIQTVCGCRIRLRWKELNALQIEVFVERDFESIVKFKLWRAFECINCLLKTFSSDEDMVNAIQLKDLKFYATQAEMLKVHFLINLSGVDSLNAPLTL